MKLVSRAAFATLLLSLAFSCVCAQETKPAYEIKVEGDNIENVKITVVENKAIDRSSARAVVESYIRVLDVFAGLMFADEHAELIKRMDAITDPAERALYEKLLTGAFIDEMKAAEDKQTTERKEREAKDTAEGKPKRKRHMPAVAGEKIVGGATVVEVEEISESISKNKEGKWEVKSDARKSRYTCSVVGTVWQIDSAETYGVDWEAKANEKGERPSVWKTEDVVAGLLQFMSSTRSAEAMPEIDTPEKLTRAAMTWLGTAKSGISSRFAADFFKQLMDKILPLFSEANVKAAKEAAGTRAKEEAERRADEKKKKLERAITTKVLEDGTTEVLVPGRSEWSGKLRIVITKTQAGLRISAAGMLRKKTDYKDGKPVETEQFEPFTSPSQFDWS